MTRSKPCAVLSISNILCGRRADSQALHYRHAGGPSCHLTDAEFSWAVKGSSLAMMRPPQMPELAILHR